MRLITKILATSVLSLSIASASPHNLDVPHTEVGFSVKHLMITNVKGKFKNFAADIDFDYATKNFNKFSATADVKSVDTGIVKRDNHLKSEDFFLADKHPQMKFVMNSYEANGDEGVMSGDLTIRGVTKKVKLNVEDLGTIKDLDGNNRVGFTLTGKINRTDFGLKWNKVLEAGGLTVGETVKIIIEAQAIER